MSPSVFLLIFCLGYIWGAPIVEPVNESNSSQSRLTLEPLFSSSFGINPVEIKFIPASVFFLIPNQTDQLVSSSGNLALQSNPLIHNYILNTESENPINNKIEPSNNIETKVNVIDEVANSAEIKNGSLVLHNLLDSIPYQSNYETINSLIENIFKESHTLQSLPPEELIFGALPSPNSTVTRTIVQDVFKNEQTPHFRELPPITILKNLSTEANLISYDNTPQYDSAYEVNHLENNLFFDKSIELNSDKLHFLPIQTTTVPSISHNNQSQTQLNVIPVSPSLGENFESNRIESIPRFRPALNQFSNNIISTQPVRVDSTIRTRTHQARPTITQIISPMMATILPELKLRKFSTTSAPVEMIRSSSAQPINSPKFSKVINYNRVMSTRAKLNKYFPTILPVEQAHSSGTLNTFNFVLNNKNILNTGQSDLFEQNIEKTVETPLKVDQNFPNKISPVTIAVTPGTVPITDKETSPNSSINVHSTIVDKLVNIISLPNFKFFLGKKTYS